MEAHTWTTQQRIADALTRQGREKIDTKIPLERRTLLSSKRSS